MNDLQKAAIDTLKAVGFEDVSQKQIDGLKGKEGVVVRRLPHSTPHGYMDGSNEVEYLLVVYCKRRSEARAIDDCERANAVLRNASLDSINGSYRFVNIDSFTEPRELPWDEGNYYVWVTQLHVTTIRKD